MSEPAGATRGANLGTIATATGHAWEEWTAWLDARGGRDLPDHGAITALVLERLRGPHAPETAPAAGNPEWWAQMVTVAYEQHLGRRRPGQRADGTFDATATRTVPGSMDEVHARAVAAFETEIATHGGRLGGVAVDGAPRSGGTDRRRAWRLNLADGSRLELTTEAAGAAPEGRTAVTLSKIPHGERVAEWKALWTAILGRV